MAEVTRARAEVTRLELWTRQRLAEVCPVPDGPCDDPDLSRGDAPQAREAYQLTLGGYRRRRTPWAQVVLSQRTYSDLVEEYMETLLELRHAETEINGMMLVDGLAQPEPRPPEATSTQRPNRADSRQTLLTPGESGLIGSGHLSPLRDRAENTRARRQGLGAGQHLVVQVWRQYADDRRRVP